MELIKKYFSALIAIISSTSVLGGGFYAYGVFENRLAQLESREYVIEQTVDLQPVYEKIDEVRDNLVLRQDGFNEKIDAAKEIMLQRISENSREIGANVSQSRSHFSGLSLASSISSIFNFNKSISVLLTFTSVVF